MRKLTLSSGIALVFVASCEGEPPGPAPLTTVTAELRAGPTDKILLWSSTTTSSPT